MFRARKSNFRFTCSIHPPLTIEERLNLEKDVIGRDHLRDEKGFEP